MDMKKTKRLFALSAFFAAGLLFAACTTSDDAEGEQEMEQGVVKAEFTISFPQQMGSVTRQSLAIVQGQTPPVFRGIQNIELLPFGTVKNDVTSTSNIPTMISLGATSTTLGYNLTPSDMTTLKSYDGEATGVHQSHLYKDISVPIGTRSFMFYGMALNESVTSGSANIPNGALKKNTATDGTTLGDISFAPVPIVGDAALNSEAAEIAKYLTNIANAGVGTESTLTLFPNFKNIRTGSWSSVKAAVQQVYNSIYEQVATGNLQEAIVNAILKQNWGTAESPDYKVFAAEEKDNTNKLTGKLIFDNITIPANTNWVDSPHVSDYPHPYIKALTCSRERRFCSMASVE